MKQEIHVRYLKYYCDFEAFSIELLFILLSTGDSEERLSLYLINHN
jgi:hypothetical protein